MGVGQVSISQFEIIDSRPSSEPPNEAISPEIAVSGHSLFSLAVVVGLIAYGCYYDSQVLASSQLGAAILTSCVQLLAPSVPALASIGFYLVCRKTMRWYLANAALFGLGLLAGLIGVWNWAFG